jgi:hypothetical protein
MSQQTEFSAQGSNPIHIGTLILREDLLLKAKEVALQIEERIRQALQEEKEKRNQ